MPRIPLSPIAVDDFSYAPGVSVYLLTHLHTDHLKGLSPSWARGVIYGSPVTLQLLRIRMPGIDETRLRPVAEGSETRLYLDAGKQIHVDMTTIGVAHCVGSVMYLLKGYFGTVLCTGDFRFSASEAALRRLPMLQQDVVDDIYLDDTFLDPRHDFPPQETTTEQVLTFLDEHANEHGRVDAVLVRTDLLGKEDLLVAIALHLETMVVVSPERMALLEPAIAHGLLPNVFTTDRDAGRVAAVPYRPRDHDLMYRSQKTGRNVVGVIPTGWVGTMPELSKHKRVLRVGYSCHSSYSELLTFVEWLRPRACHSISRGDRNAAIDRYVGHLLRDHPAAPVTLLDRLDRGRKVPHAVLSALSATLPARTLSQHPVRDKDAQREGRPVIARRRAGTKLLRASPITPSPDTKRATEVQGAQHPSVDDNTGPAAAEETPATKTGRQGAVRLGDLPAGVQADMLELLSLPQDAPSWTRSPPVSVSDEDGNGTSARSESTSSGEPWTGDSGQAPSGAGVVSIGAAKRQLFGFAAPAATEATKAAEGGGVTGPSQESVRWSAATESESERPSLPEREEAPPPAPRRYVGTEGDSLRASAPAPYRPPPRLTAPLQRGASGPGAGYDESLVVMELPDLAQRTAPAGNRGEYEHSLPPPLPPDFTVSRAAPPPQTPYEASVAVLWGVDTARKRPAGATVSTPMKKRRLTPEPRASALREALTPGGASTPSTGAATPLLFGQPVDDGGIDPRTTATLSGATHPHSSDCVLSLRVTPDAVTPSQQQQHGVWAARQRASRQFTCAPQRAGSPDDRHSVQDVDAVMDMLDIGSCVPDGCGDAAPPTVNPGAVRGCVREDHEVSKQKQHVGMWSGMDTPCGTARGGIASAGGTSAGMATDGCGRDQAVQRLRDFIFPAKATKESETACVDNEVVVRRALRYDAPSPRNTCAVPEQHRDLLSSSPAASRKVPEAAADPTPHAPRKGVSWNPVPDVRFMTPLSASAAQLPCVDARSSWREQWLLADGEKAAAPTPAARQVDGELLLASAKQRVIRSLVSVGDGLLTQLGADHTASKEAQVAWRPPTPPKAGKRRRQLKKQIEQVLRSPPRVVPHGEGRHGGAGGVR
eukprot:TRINITY_DN15301_c0_g1_i1.p1 TRINITY_DN15301_c0_g1~~TRINITY_DN15301_c0_g1_i1.p1  ORF type:complete len:1106 (+),score=106.75 TRINITY_DN15301_c0_g1_i1:153-3470(+)